VFLNIQFILAHYSANVEKTGKDSGSVPRKFRTSLPLLLGLIILADMVSINVWYQREMKLNIK
jgi:hypothetical protein